LWGGTHGGVKDLGALWEFLTHEVSLNWEAFEKIFFPPGRQKFLGARTWAASYGGDIEGSFKKSGRGK